MKLVYRSSYRWILPETQFDDRTSLYIGQLRDLSVTALSLAAVEKVQAHDVVKWVKEDELEAQVGLQTAFRLVWMLALALTLNVVLGIQPNGYHEL